MSLDNITADDGELAVDKYTLERQASWARLAETPCSPSEGAARLGVSLDQALAEAPDLATEIEDTLSDPRWTAATAQRVAGPTGGRATPGALLGAVIVHAASLKKNRQAAAARQEQRDAERTCLVTGQVDPSTRYRAMPWSSPAGFGVHTAGARVSDRGFLAIMAAAISTVTPAELDAARALVGVWPEPTASPAETTTGRRRRK